MDYLYIVNAFKQQQQQFLLHQHQIQQQLQNHHNSAAAAAGNPLSLQQQHDNTNMANSLLWQPWRDLQHAAAVHHHLYRQQQQQQQQQQQREQMEKEARLSSKELPTAAWRRERRLRTGEYHHPLAHHHHHHHSSPGSSTSSVRAISPSSSPPPAAHSQLSPTPVSAVASTQLHSNAHQISMMMAAAAAAGMRPLCESTNRPSPPPASSHAAVVGSMHSSHIANTQVLQQLSGMDTDDAPLDMSVSSSLKQRNSPPPPYREPLPGSTFASSLPRPSVITQAPPKRETRDSTLIENRENDNRSSESIDEHFRRSLGNDYFALFAKKSPGSQTTKAPSPQPNHQPQPPIAHARTPPSTPTAIPVTSIVLPPPPSALNQSALVPPPAYPMSSLPPNHQLHHLQTQTLKSAKTNTIVMSPTAVGNQLKGNPPLLTNVTAEPNSSPPLPLVVRSHIQQQLQQQQQQPLALQRSSSLTTSTPLPSPQSPIVKTTSAPVQSPVSSTAGSRTASPLPCSNAQVVPTTLSRFSSVENSPSSSPRHTPPSANSVAVPNASPTLPAIMRIKTEPGLQSIKSHNPTPPASPTSTTNPNIMMMSGFSSHAEAPSSPSSPSAVSASSTATIKSNSTTAGGNSSAEVLASVDDHFAKALGDTWKRLQESKDIRK